jgi:hypothetical protein
VDLPHLQHSQRRFGLFVIELQLIIPLSDLAPNSPSPYLQLTKKVNITKEDIFLATIRD